MTVTESTTAGDTVIAAPEDVVHHLTLDLVRPDPTNMRDKLRDIEGLTASVLARGVLDAITVRMVSTDDEGIVYMVCRGHRRLAAALAAQKVDPSRNSIPARIVSAEQAERDRVTDRMTENIQRDALTTAETAQGIQQLLDLGDTTEGVATSLGLDRDVVEKAATVAGSKGVGLVTKRFDITMDQAAALVEFEGNKEVFKELTELVVDSPDAFERRVVMYRRAKKNEEMVEAAAVEWRERGYEVLSWDDASKGATVPLHALKPDKGNATHMTPAGHKGCPHRAVVLNFTNWPRPKVEVSEYCTDPSGHEALSVRGRGGSLEEPKAPPTEKETRARREHLAGMALSRVAQDIRRAWVADLLKRKAPVKGLVPFVVSQLVAEHAGMEGRHAPMFGQLIGVETDSAYNRQVSVQSDYLARCAGRELTVLLARVASEREYRWEPNTWRSSFDDDLRVPYLRFLMANGYVPTTVEKVILGEATAEDVVKERDAEKARAKLAKASSGSVAAPPRVRGPAKKARRRAPARKAVQRRARS